MAISSPFLMIHPPIAANSASNSHTVAAPVAHTVAAPVAHTVAAPVTTPMVAMTPLRIANNQMVFRNPSLGILFWNLPKPRSSFALPTLISPTATPNDQTLFDEPQPGGQQHYLPAYALATTGSGNQTQFAVSLAASSSGYLLTVKFNDVTPMNILSNHVREMPATLYMLTATLPSRTETWSFPTATVDGTSITLSMPITDPAVRDAIYSAMTDQSQQAKLILRRSPSLAVPVPSTTPGSQQLYRQSAVAIDTSIDFYFDQNLDKNVFANLPNVGGQGPSTLNHVSIPYPATGAKSYSYWQDPLQPSQIYFLPDSYKIARLATSPHSPAINVTTSGSDPATLSVTMAFFALPVWDPNRITTAAAGPLLTAFGISSVTNLSVLPATSAQLLLNLPSTDPSATTAPVPITNASIDTANGIQASVTLSLTQFQQVYNALFVSPSVLLSGQVNVTVNQNTEQVPFSARASDFAGTIFDTTAFVAAPDEVTVVATNGIESPVHVPGLAPTLLNGNTQIPSTLLGFYPLLPVDLKPVPSGATPGADGGSGSASGTESTVDKVLGLASGLLGGLFKGHTAVSDSLQAAESVGSGSVVKGSSLTMVLKLASGQTFDPQSDTVQLDTTQTVVIPDSRAIWSAIVQNQVVAPVQKQITIQLPAGVFGSQSGSATSTTSSDTTGGSYGTASLLAVQVVFQNGQTATFQSSMPASGGILSQTIGLNVDIENYILGQGDSSNYTYRVDLITASGTQQGSWTTSNVDDLFVTLG
ncbi:MAG: hypothetical protein ACRD3S_21170 [Terracidiphilus sp.]